MAFLVFFLFHGCPFLGGALFWGALFGGTSFEGGPLFSEVRFFCGVEAAAKPSRQLKQMPSIRIWEGTSEFRKLPAKDVTLTPFLPSSEACSESPGVPTDGALCPGGPGVPTGSALCPGGPDVPTDGALCSWDSGVPMGGSDSGVPAVIVCPGGSYFWLDEQTEGADVASWLCENGIAAFVLRYRTAGVFRFCTGMGSVKHPDMLNDLQRAIAFLRQNSARFGIDPNMLGVMGFSAGGHLVMSAAEFYDRGTLRGSEVGADVVAADVCSSGGSSCGGASSRSVSLRPDFVAPIYPVVSMSDPCTHARSRRALLGEGRKNDRALRDSLSLEKHVRDDCPPVFLLNCVDDDVVDYHNSELLDSALTAHRVPHLYTQYAVGGHGFGATKSKQGPQTSLWQDLFINWFRKL